MNSFDQSIRESLKGYKALEELALDLRSTWHHSADVIWRKIEPELWELTHNPWAVLQAASREKIVEVLEDNKISTYIDDQIKNRNNEINSPGWFQDKYPKSPLKKIAYFSMEFMLSEALPIYSGGLGNVAGDQLKAASDLGVPVIAVGLLYSQGYFRQIIDKDGNQQEFYPYNDPGQLPIRPLRTESGEWIRLKIPMPGWPLWLRIWVANVGRTTLYLLDTNDVANVPTHRGITSELYGGNKELRLKQEMVLGIGGWRLLDSLGINPEVCHLNEGHAALAVLERAYCYMQKTGQSFDVALTATRAGNIFTTHTAVVAGFDHFSPDLIKQYLEMYTSSRLGISIDKLMALGQLHPGDDFNMAYLAIRGSGFINGVSKLHSEVSRSLFKDLFPRFPEEDIPVGYVTNGVHMPSWDSALSDELWTEACGKSRWLGKTEELGEKIRCVPDEKIWEMRNLSRASLVEYSRSRLGRQLGARGAPIEEIDRIKTFLNHDVLTLAFARRFATYKRPDLLLYDPERLLRILTNRERPVQLIIAGKAHPADNKGRALIKKWVTFVKIPEAREHVVFLSDYDVSLTEHLVAGADVWINTPRRPWEASGTSGMKVLVNGGLNLSELDGWWAEAYEPEVGWALGDRKEHGDDPANDWAEANALYELLENEVVPEFYQRDDKGLPKAWIKRIRESMARLTPIYSSNRSVREYTEKYYLPAANNYLNRTENNGALAKQIVDWEDSIKQHWNKLGFGELKIDTNADQHRFEVQVFLDTLDRQAVEVQLFSQDLTLNMKYEGVVPNTLNGYIYSATVSAELPVSSFTPRILPYFPGVAVPQELTQILWQR